MHATVLLPLIALSVAHHGATAGPAACQAGLAASLDGEAVELLQNELKLGALSAEVNLDDFQAGKAPGQMSAPVDHAGIVGRIVLWLHIQKTAGHFMCESASAAGEHVVLVDGKPCTCQWPGVDDSLWPNPIYSGLPYSPVSCEAREKHFRKNNFTFGLIERELSPTDRCWGRFVYGVMLREPIDRMLSVANYLGTGKRPSTLLRSEIASPGSSHWFRDWMAGDNYMVRMLAPALEVPAGKINETHFQQAMETLSHFHIVQRLEDLPDNAGALFAALGWPAELKGRLPEKVNAASSYEHTFTAEETAWLKEVNRYDYALYNSYR